MLKALLLDFGGVISKSNFEIHPLTEKILGLPPGTLTWHGPFDPASDLLWQAMQRDELTEREYWSQRAREIGELIGQTWMVNDYMAATKCASPDEAIRPEAVETVKLAKAKGLKVGVLTNELELFYGRACMDNISILREIDMMVDATHTKILKPRPEAYHFAINALGLAPHEILFVDDQMRNVIGGQNVGLEAFHFDFTRPAESYAQIRERLGLR
jgi:putative hydrolase of the HAD superfamily